MSAEIVEVRVSRSELAALRELAYRIGNMLKMLETKEAKTETAAGVLTLLTVLRRAEES
jgi:hypothetical protein